MEIVSALGDPDGPDRQEDAELAQVPLAGVSKTGKTAAAKDIAEYRMLRRHNREGS